jgi:hypothetical protein
LSRLDLLIVEARLGGREIAGRLLPLHPEMKVVYLSTWPRESLEEDGQMEHGAVFIAKPFVLPVLQKTVAALLST